MILACDCDHVKLGSFFTYQTCFVLRERKIQQIEASFEASKSHPVHATNKILVPKEVMPLFPDFDRYDIIYCFC